MEIDQSALFTFLGTAVTLGVGAYITISNRRALVPVIAAAAEQKQAIVDTKEQVKEVHKLANDNLSKQTELVASGNDEVKRLNEKMESVAVINAQKIEGLHSMIAELSRKLPGYVAPPMVVGSVDPVPSAEDLRVARVTEDLRKPKGTEDDPIKVEIAAQAKPVDVIVKE